MTTEPSVRSRAMRTLLLCAVMLPSMPRLMAQAALPMAPCGYTWGDAAQTAALEDGMPTFSPTEAIAAIDMAKVTRGERVGCANRAYTYTAPDFTAPTFAVVRANWQSVHVPVIAGYTPGCPALGRDWSAWALGAYYARRAGNDDVPLETLAAIARMQADTQYTPRTAENAPVGSEYGVYGYLNTDAADPCFLALSGGDQPVGGVVADSCRAQPRLCVRYTGGIYAGQTFQVADIGVTDVYINGPIDYDQGFAGVAMIEAARHAADPEARVQFLQSALRAGEWAAAEPPVRNENYTAKLIWLLAELYDLTGDGRWRDAMLDKVERSLKPSVLMDANGNGMVDDMVNQPFRALTPAAQRPGRNWDGHNAQPQYVPINAWAAVEAYVALRDRGDADDAASLRPYTLAMLDNIAWEVNHLGVPSVGRTQIPYALLLGLWKIAAYEGEPHPEWESAAWAIWNAGTFKVQNNSYDVGLYLLYLSGTPYTPLSYSDSAPG